MDIARISALVAAVTLSLPARAADVIAVLPLDTTKATLQPADRALLDEELQTTARLELQPLGYTVVAGDAVNAILREIKADPDKPCEGACAAEVARKSKATFLLTGALFTSEGVHVARLRLSDTTDNPRILAALGVEGATLTIVRQKWAAEAKAFFARGLGLVDLAPTFDPPPPPVTPVAPVAPVATLSTDLTVKFESTPPGAFVLVDGTPLCPETPCTKVVLPGVHDVSMTKTGYEPSNTKETFERGASVSKVLAPNFATLEITTTPPGLPVRVDIEAAAPSPLTRQLDPGAHDVVIVDPCFESSGDRVTLVKAEKRTLALTGAAKTAELTITAKDAAGAALAAEAIVDGRSYGNTPGTLKVPMCAKVLEVRLGELVYREDLSLKQNEARDVVAVLRKEGEPVPVGTLKLTLDGAGMKRTWYAVTLENAVKTEKCELVRDPVGCKFEGLTPGRWRMTLSGGGFDARTAIDLVSDGALTLSGGVPDPFGRNLGLGLALSVASLFGVGLEQAMVKDALDVTSASLMLTGVIAAAAAVKIWRGSGEEDGQSLGVVGLAGASEAWGYASELDAWTISAGYWHKLGIGARAERQILRYLSAGVLVGHPGIGVTVTLQPTRRGGGYYLAGGFTVPFFTSTDAISKYRLAGAAGLQAHITGGLGLRLGLTVGVNAEGPVGFVFGPDASLIYQL